MTKEEILVNNEFANCTTEELKEYWEELKWYYKNGYIPIDTKLGKMRDIYCARSNIGVVVLEQDLLRAIACNSFEKQ